MVVVDNYSVHTSERVSLERRAVAAADVLLVYLPATASSCRGCKHSGR